MNTFVTLAVFACVCGAQAQYYKVQENLGKELFEDYNGDIKPMEKVNVTLDMYVRDIFEINTAKGYMSFQVTFRQSWHDQRLAYNNKPKYSNVEFYTVGRKGMENMWFPDTFFRNEIESKVHSDLVDNSYVRIFPDGKVMYSTRISLKTICNPRSSANSYNTLKCPVQVASYGWQQKDIQYEWKHDNPFQYNKMMSVRGFTLMPDHSETEDLTITTSTGSYSAALLNLVFQKTIDPAMYCNSDL